MYTLKIKWLRYEKVEPPDDLEASSQTKLADETTLFIPADEIHVHGETKLEQMSAWEDGSYFNYMIVSTENVGWGSRLIQVVRNGKDTWYLVSMAWILGPDGGTIERLI
jgi:hypothetical protein